MGEKFAFSQYRSRLDITYEGQMVLHENMMMEPQNQPLDGLGYYEGYTHQAMLFLFGTVCPNEKEAAECLEKVPEIEFGVTKTMLGGMIFRILGTSAEQLQLACEAIERIAV